LKWGQLAGPIAAADPESDQVPIEYAIERFLKVQGAEGENIDPATLRKYDVLLNGRLMPWCTAHSIRTVKELESKVVCEDFVLSWRNLNPARDKRNVRRTEKLLSRTTKCAELGRLRYWITQNGAKKIRVESRGRGEPKYGLNPSEYELLLSAAKTRKNSWGNPSGKKAKEMQVMVQLLRWSGLRISDAAMLEESQLRKIGGRYVIVIERMEQNWQHGEGADPGLCR